MHTSRLLCTVAAAVALSACTLGTVADSEKVIESQTEKVPKLRKLSEQPMDAAPETNVEVRDDVYVGGQAFRSENGDPLPSYVERGDLVLNTGPTPVTLQSVAGRISEITGIPVQVNLDLDRFSGGNNDDVSESPDGSTSGSTSGSSEGPNVRPPSDVSTSTEVQGNSSIESSATSIKVRVNHHGKLSDLLGKLTNQNNLMWDYDGGVIRIYRYITRTFSLAILPSAHTIDNKVTSQSQSSESDSNISGSSLSVESSTDSLNSHENLLEDVETIIGDQGSVNIAESTGTMTVVAEPNGMAEVKRYVRAYNERRSRQVALNVRVYSLQLNDADNYGIDFTALFDGIDGLDLSMTSPGTSPIGAAELGWAILDDTWSSGSQNTNGLIKALSTQGDVSVVTSGAVTTLNNTPAPISVIDKEGYLKEVSSESGDGYTSRSFEPGEVISGFNINVLPKIMDDGTILLQYGVDLSENLGFTEIGDIDGGNGIQAPRIKSRSFIQQVAVPTGATLVLSGFERNESTVDKQGVGSPSFPLLGGGQSGEMDREMVVIAITPRILDTQGKFRRLGYTE